MYATILFDLDGTLTDPFQGITNAVLYALGKLGICETDRQKLAAFIGPPLYSSFSEYYGMSTQEAVHAVAVFREYYTDKGWRENHPYTGIAQALKVLRGRGKKLYVATSKPETMALKVLEHFALLPLFEGVAGATEDESRVEKADVIAYCMQRFDIRREGTLMVGDRKHDVIGAKKNMLPCAGVLYGFGSREELLAAGADLLVPTPAQLAELP